MALTTINGCVLFPHIPNYAAAKPRLSRAWQTVIKTGTTGSEEREALKAVPYRSLKYTLTCESQVERAMCEARIAAAVQSGAACCPLAGRGARVTTAIGPADTVIVLDSYWTWAVDDYVFVMRADVASKPWAVRQITNVVVVGSAVTLTLASAFGIGIPVSGPICVWPLLYGKLTPGAMTPGDLYKGNIEITVAEPVGVLVFGSSATCGALSDPPTPPDPYSICEGPGTLSIDAATCGTTRTLRWTGDSEADSYNLYVGAQSGGPYTLHANYARTVFSSVVNVPFFSDAGQYYMINLAYGAPAYWIVKIVIGGVEVGSSDEVQMPALTLEMMMCAFQERAVAGDTLSGEAAPPPYPLIWPALITSPFTAAAAFPPAGFYAPDITTAAHAATQIGAMASVIEADVFVDNWGGQYVVGSLQGLAVGSIPYLDNGVNFIIPSGVTSANYMAAALELLTAACQLYAMIKGAATYNPSCSGRSASATAPWPADTNPALATACEACVLGNVAGVPWGHEYDYDSTCLMTADNAGPSPPIQGSFGGGYDFVHSNYFGFTGGVRGSVRTDLSALAASGTGQLFTSITSSSGTSNPLGWTPGIYYLDQAATLGAVWTSGYVAGSDQVNSVAGDWELYDAWVLAIPAWTYLPYPV